MSFPIHNINPIRRFTASKAAAETVSREEFDALEQKVDSLLEEVDTILSPENLTATIETALRPLMEKIEASAKDVKVANRSRFGARHDRGYLLPSDDEPMNPVRGNTSVGRRADAYRLPEGD